MARGDGGLFLRLPQRNDRPGSASAVHSPGYEGMGGPSTNYGRAVLGDNAAASASSASLNVVPRSSQDAPHPRQGQVSMGISNAGAPPPEPTADAPFLATSEAHLGRMTLTAPDNMRRRKAEEREKRQKARKRKAEQQAVAGGEAGPSRQAIAAAVALVGLPTTTTTTVANRSSTQTNVPRRPQLGASRSTSNLTTLSQQQQSHQQTQALQTSQQQQQQQQQQQRQEHRRDAMPAGRSLSPTRQTRRPRSAQSHINVEASPERPASASAEVPLHSPARIPAHPSQDRRQRRRKQPRDGAGNQQGPSTSRQAANGRPPRRSREETQRREAIRDEVLRRATRRRRDIYADLPALGLPGASGDEDDENPPPPFPGIATRPRTPPPIPADGEEWTEELRRRHEEYNANRPPESPPPAFYSDGEHGTTSPWLPSRDGSIETRSTSSEGEEETLSSDARRQWEADRNAGYSLEERIERERLRREKLIGDASLATMSSEPSAMSNATLGQLVNSARSRRGLRSEADLAHPESRSEDDRAGAITDRLPRNAQILAQEARAGTSSTEQASAQGITQGRHRRTISDNADNNALERDVTVKVPKHSNTAAIGTGQGLISQPQHGIDHERYHAKPTKIRPRPSTKVASRFRDDASSAAYRRQALWGKTLSDAVQPASALMPQGEPSMLLPISKTPGPSVQPSDRTPTSNDLPQPRRASESAATVPAEDDSSDSEDAWKHEETEFTRLQSLHDAPTVVDSSDEDELVTVPDAIEHRLGYSRQSARLQRSPIELGKVGKSVPKAPPPLVLGRSRGGGAAYSSSSESSSDSEEGRLREYEDETGSESPVDVEDAVSEGEHLSSTSAGSQIRPDKGKQRMQTPFPVERNNSFPSTSSLRPSFESHRAGTFEDLSDDDDVDSLSEEDVVPGPPLRASIGASDKSEVSNRLKGLFSMQLSDRRPSNDQAFAAVKEINDGNAGVSRQSRDSFDQSGVLAASPQSTTSLRRSSGHDDSHTNVDSIVEAHAESRARREALEQLSQVKRSSGHMPSDVDRDALAVLERLLLRSGIHGNDFAGHSTESRDSKRNTLQRSNAIANRASFVNPRSSIAPRPLGRLPTITDATRHFPAEPHAPRDSHLSPPISARSPQPAVPAWMTKIPAAERAHLQMPLEPTRRAPASSLQDSGGETPFARQPPPLPPRAGSGRVGAMIAAIEQQSRAFGEPARSSIDTQDVSQRARVRNHESAHSFSSGQEYNSSARQSPIRRRPPPPPPRPPTAVATDRAETTNGNASRSEPSIASQRRNNQLSASSSQSRVDAQSSAYTGPNIDPAEHSAVPPPLVPSSSTNTHKNRPLPVPPVSSRAAGDPPNPDEIPANVQLARMTQNVSPSPPRQSPRISDVSTMHHAPQGEQSTHDLRSIGTSLMPSGQPSERAQGDATIEISPVASPSGEQIRAPETSARMRSARREASLGLTDLDIFASRLADARQNQQDGGEGADQEANGSGQRDTYDDLHLLAEFLGPAKQPGLTPEEMEALPVGRVEVTRRRVVGKRDDGRDKVKLSLAVAGVKVERCGVCLVQFKEGNMACVFPCMHVLHEKCAQRLLRNTKNCPTCREPVIG